MNSKYALTNTDKIIIPLIPNAPGSKRVGFCGLDGHKWEEGGEPSLSTYSVLQGLAKLLSLMVVRSHCVWKSGPNSSFSNTG